MRASLTVLVTSLLALTAAHAGEFDAGRAEAPGFALQDQEGTTVRLSDHDGSIRVLEWTNPDCPFVKRHYDAGTMKRLATRYAEQGVVWLTVNSTNYMGAEANAAFHAAHELPYPVLDDSAGTVGHAYDARTTPHLFVIDRDGAVVYRGAIDDDPRGTKGDDAVNYVAQALDELLAGKPITVPETKPYGCSVKYRK